MTKFMTKCSLCNKTIVVNDSNKHNYKHKCSDCKKKIAAKLAGKSGSKG